MRLSLSRYAGADGAYTLRTLYKASRRRKIRDQPSSCMSFVHGCVLHEIACFAWYAFLRAMRSQMSGSHGHDWQPS